MWEVEWIHNDQLRDNELNDWLAYALEKKGKLKRLRHYRRDKHTTTCPHCGHRKNTYEKVYDVP